MRNTVRLVLVVLLLISLAANAFMYQRFRNRRVTMSYNNHNVTQQDIYDYLLQNSGPAVKFNMIQRYMIEDEAKKRGVVPDSKEVDEAYNQMRELNLQFAQQVAAQPFMEPEFKARIKQQIEDIRLRTIDIPVSEDQIKEEYNAQTQAFDTPAKAHTRLALIINISDIDKIKELMEKDVSPQLIQTNFPSSVRFVGDNDVFTFVQPFGSKQNAQIFAMKPGQVQVFPPDVFAQAGAQKLLIRLVDIKEGSKADLNDKKTHEKLREAVAAKRAKPSTEYLNKLWGDGSNFKSEDPKDKMIIDQYLKKRS